jgi:hypothetical protein
MAARGQVVLEHLVFEDARRGEVFAAGNDLGQAGAALAFAAAVGDAGADFFGDFDQAGAGRYGDGDADILRR